jgi:hypothetical protein
MNGSPCSPSMQAGPHILAHILLLCVAYQSVSFVDGHSDNVPLYHIQLKLLTLVLTM